MTWGLRRAILNSNRNSTSSNRDSAPPTTKSTNESDQVQTAASNASAGTVTDTCAQEQEMGHDVVTLLENSEWTHLIQLVTTRQGKAQVQQATWEAAQAIQASEDDMDAASRPLAPLELALWNRRRPPEEVVYALIQAFPQAARLLYNPHPRFLSGSVVLLQKVCKLGPNDPRLSLRVVQALLKAHAPATQIADRTGRLALHVACQTNAPLEIVQELVAAYPEAASVADNCGMLPLHLLCTAVLVPSPTSSASPRCENFNTMANTSTVNFRSSLSSSCSCSGAAKDEPSSQPRTTVQVLLQAFAHALYSADKYGRLPIHCACARGDEQEHVIVEMLRMDSSLATIPCRDDHVKSGSGEVGGRRRQQGGLPLFTACFVEHSTRVVRHLLRDFPLAAGIPNTVGCLPLCHVPARPTSSATLQIGTAAAAAVTGSGGRDDAIDTQRDVQDQTNDDDAHHHHDGTNAALFLPRVWQDKWHLLVDAYPGALFRHCNTCRRSPLDKQAVEGRALLIQTSLSKHHLSVPHGEDGDLVLHTACRQPRVSIDDLRLLVDIHPGALSTPNVVGELPLHAALAKKPGVSVGVVRFLVERHADALSTADIDGKLPLHIAVANEYYQEDELTHLQVVEFLLESLGSALYVPSKEGCYPLLSALRNQEASLSILYALLRQHPTILLTKGG